jgi:HEAT repeat protein
MNNSVRWIKRFKDFLGICVVLLVILVIELPMSFASAGFLTKWISFGIGDGRFNFPRGLVVLHSFSNPQGALVVHGSVANSMERIQDSTFRLPTQVELMISQLKHSDDPFVRVDAAQTLGSLRAEEAVDALLLMLRDDNLYVRAYSAEALGKIGDLMAVDLLIVSLNDPQPFVQSFAAQSLGELKAQKAVNTLIAFLGEGHLSVRPHAAWALGMIGDPSAVNPLIAALRAEDVHLRISATRALGLLGSFDAVEQLIKVLKDEECYGEAAVALKKITALDFGTDHDLWLGWHSSRGGVIN